MREYDVLADLLERFLSEETVKLQSREVSAADCFGLTQRLGHAVRSLMQTTVDTFASQYTATIAEQTARLESFNRMLMHELRTPLGTLVFAGELLSRAEATGDHDACMRLVTLIRRNLEHLAGSVRGIERLVFAEPVIGGPNRQEVDIGSLTTEVARQLGGMATARGVEFRVDPELPKLVTDAGQLELVLMNLVSNGIKYSDPKKATRYVEVAGQHEHHAFTYTFCVQDNGLGIPGGLLGSVFKRFFRAHHERDEELGVEGFGLGLSIVEESVRVLGGHMRVESVEGEGTAFYINLPEAAAMPQTLLTPTVPPSS